MRAVRRVVTETVSGLPRAFWWLWTSTLINRLGGFVVTFLAMYLTLDRGFSATYAGLVGALYGLGGAVAAIVGGVLTDRVGRRTTMLASQIGAAVSTAALGFVTQPVAIAAVAFAVGVTSSASRPAVQAMMADLVPAEDRVRAFSLNYWAINIGFGVSAAVAGLIAAHGYLSLFLGDAVTTLLCALVVFVKVPETRPSTTPRHNAVDQPAIGLGQVVRDGRFMALVGLTFLIATVMQQGSTTLSVSMGEAGLTPGQYGLVIGLNGLLIVLLQIPVTRLMRDRGRAALLASAALLQGWGFGLTYFAGTAACYALTVAVWTLGEIIWAPTSMAVVADLSPAHARGRYQGMYSLAWSAATFLGPMAGGAALDRWGSAMWPTCGLVGTVAAVGCGLLLRRTPVRPASGAAPARAATPGGAAPAGSLDQAGT
ncbi:MDR family MFS transporter [Streptantibioticus rubrisoli]|uniref:MFS transporter n=1 Tax=Streptantibioticus rubrisoli TaxID=1387313 RepID=A0ABT1PK58_9ACTN|nr:MFS transporter [Streptantibioticus rubrisoli]MCQ4045747.1 MFS transporter [Streptantibioticus rubrisoli]